MLLSWFFQWYGSCQYYLEQWFPPAPIPMQYQFHATHPWQPLASQSSWDKLLDQLLLEWRYASADLTTAPLALAVQRSGKRIYLYEPPPLDATQFHEVSIRLTDLSHLAAHTPPSTSPTQWTRSELVQLLEQVSFPQSWGPSVLGVGGVTFHRRRGAALSFGQTRTWLQLSLRPDAQGVNTLHVLAICADPR